MAQTGVVTNVLHMLLHLKLTYFASSDHVIMVFDRQAFHMNCNVGHTFVDDERTLSSRRSLIDVRSRVLLVWIV